MGQAHCRRGRASCFCCAWHAACKYSQAQQRCKVPSVLLALAEHPSTCLTSALHPCRCILPQRDVDQYGRIVAVCSLAQPDGSSLDLNDWMVRQGNAVAYTRFTDEYVAAQEEARAARRGLWQGEFL